MAWYSQDIIIPVDVEYMLGSLYAIQYYAMLFSSSETTLKGMVEVDCGKAGILLGIVEALIDVKGKIYVYTCAKKDREACVFAPAGREIELDETFVLIVDDYRCMAGWLGKNEKDPREMFNDLAVGYVLTSM